MAQDKAIEKDDLHDSGGTGFQTSAAPDARADALRTTADVTAARSWLSGHCSVAVSVVDLLVNLTFSAIIQYDCLYTYM